jgi:metallophosphoesterase superfamily enzyme
VSAAKHIARVIVPDSHGAHIDESARTAFLKDLSVVRPEQIVMLGDHLDCGGTFNTHQRNYTHEICETYEDDCEATNSFLDAIQKRVPDAEIHYIEGNHEAHVERWAARTFHNKKDADKVLERFGPTAVLRLKERGIKYYKRSEHYMGLSIPGCIRLGKCYFVHGVSHSKHAAATHLARFGANVVFGHVHRSQGVVERTVVSQGFGAWCPGTLAKLQPLYAHTAPTSWSHGYGLQFVNVSSGKFVHWNVPIFGDSSLLLETVDLLGRRQASTPRTRVKGRAA